MLWVLLLGLAIGLATFLFMLIARYATRLIAGAVEGRMRAAETIVNAGRIPEAWIAPYQKKRNTLQADPDALAQLGRQARADCLKKLDDLLHFFENDRITDSMESRLVLQKALQQARSSWQKASGEFFLNQEPVSQS